MLRDAFLLSALLAAAVDAADAPPTRREVAPGVFAYGLSARYGSANGGWVDFGDHAVLIGAPHPEPVAAVLEALKGKPVRGAILTHALRGEMDAARVLLQRGIPIIAERQCVDLLRKEIEKAPETSALLAKPLWRDFEERLDLGSGPQRLEIRGWPLAAGIGSAAVHVPERQVLFAGDLCVSGPRADLTRGHSGLWLDALEAMRGLPLKVVVPGFGTIREGAEARAALERQRRFLQEIRRQVAFGIIQEQPLERWRDQVRLAPEWMVWMPYDTPTREDIESLHRELTAPEAPYGRRPFPPSDPRPRALALIGDRVHDPAHLEAGLGRAFEAAGLAVRFAVDVRALSAASLAQVKLLVILRDGMVWPDGTEKPYKVWMTPDEERAVVDFVEAGGGFLPLHNATGLYPAGGPYLALLGGTYNGHGPLERFRVRVVDAGHPITRGVSEYEIADEQHTPIPAPGVRILLESRSDEGVAAPAGWVKEVGKGRVAYLANGHTREALLHPSYQLLLRNAMRWCAGLEAP
jgi:hypothetical protein